MAVVPKITHSESPDGKTLTLIDSSDYTTGNINNYTRKVELYSGINGTGSLITSIDFVGTNLSVDYETTADRYYSAKLIFTGTPSVASVYTNFVTVQREYNALNKFLNRGCGCGSKSESEKVRYGFIYLKLAEKATLGGNSGLANQNITASAKWLI